MAFRMLDARLAVLAVWLATLAVAVVIVGPENIPDPGRITPGGIREFVLSYGALAAIVYEAMHALRPFTFLPATPFTIAGGYIFGPVYGLVLAMAGTTLAATITFYLSRYVFRDFVRRRLSTRYAGFDSRFDGGGMLTVASLRFIPVLPFDAVGYVAGVSSIRYRDYLGGTLIGEFPGALVLTLLGDRLTDFGSPGFYASLALACLLFILPEAYRRIRKRR